MKEGNFVVLGRGVFAGEEVPDTELDDDDAVDADVDMGAEVV
jgi:hypothetical protein